MYRGIFTVGVAVVQGFSFHSDDEVTDYSYINGGYGNRNGAVIARCLTGLGPTSTATNANVALGGLYFNGIMIPSSDASASCASTLGVIQVRPGSHAAGVLNFHQCGAFTTDHEGVYTCTIMNSSIMDQSVRFGIYFSVRSESLDYISIT